MQRLPWIERWALKVSACAHFVISAPTMMTTSDSGESHCEHGPRGLFFRTFKENNNNMGRDPHFALELKYTGCCSARLNINLVWVIDQPLQQHGRHVTHRCRPTQPLYYVPQSTRVKLLKKLWSLWWLNIRSPYSKQRGQKYPKEWCHLDASKLITRQHREAHSEAQATAEQWGGRCSLQQMKPA